MSVTMKKIAGFCFLLLVVMSIFVAIADGLDPNGKFSRSQVEEEIKSRRERKDRNMMRDMRDRFGLLSFSSCLLFVQLILELDLFSSSFLPSWATGAIPVPAGVMSSAAWSALMARP